MKIIEYLPSVLAEIREFKVLGEAEDLQLDNLKTEINSLTNELFVTTAERVGLDRWEKILNITNSSTDVEFRRFRILSRLNSFGLTLNQRLSSIVGSGNYKADYYFKEYRLKVSLTLDTKEYEKEVRRMLDEVVPANLLIDFGLLYNTHEILGRFTHEQLSKYTHQKIREDARLNK